MTTATTRTARSRTIRFIVTAGMLAAIASVLRYLEMQTFIFPPFLKIDLSNVPALIGGFALGPWAGAAILLIKNLIYLPATQTGGIGELADFVVSLTLVLPASLIYMKSKNRAGALWGMALGTAIMSILGGPLMNYYVLVPLYTNMFKMTIDIWPYILYSIVPFNLFKSVVICVITYLLYKPLSPVLHKYK